ARDRVAGLRVDYPTPEDWVLQTHGELISGWPRSQARLPLVTVDGTAPEGLSAPEDNHRLIPLDMSAIDTSPVTDSELEKIAQTEATLRAASVIGTLGRSSPETAQQLTDRYRKDALDQLNAIRRKVASSLGPRDPKEPKDPLLAKKLALAQRQLI